MLSKMLNISVFKIIASPISTLTISTFNTCPYMLRLPCQTPWLAAGLTSLTRWPILLTLWSIIFILNTNMFWTSLQEKMLIFDFRSGFSQMYHLLNENMHMALSIPTLECLVLSSHYTNSHVLDSCIAYSMDMF